MVSPDGACKGLLRAGDELVRINDTDVAHFSLGEARQVLESPPLRITLWRMATSPVLPATCRL
eukprot:5858878-Prorocentrum_lima.AAC.1